MRYALDHDPDFAGQVTPTHRGDHHADLADQRLTAHKLLQTPSAALREPQSDHASLTCAIQIVHPPCHPVCPGTHTDGVVVVTRRRESANPGVLAGPRAAADPRE
ncbi:hypothetical protein GCM10017581_087210 [Dactylosporangium matsuzakiense]|uniref:Uncharacterized protein n=1 Tax=Dactylosporangium matsuzakiense TaxID=53360 RepID=A0A9W6NR86_9ACTN|nr:hypothetical protein GCM10017581_087210 [Dactylosporangium matsuzakiense]